MSDAASHPATVGQLSVWRDVEKIPAERRWEANLSFVWDLPAGTWTADEVWTALGALAVRHASLRTTYVVTPDGHLRQRIAVDTAEEVLAAIRGDAEIGDTADVSERAALEISRVQQTIDVTRFLPWRVYLLTEDGAPRQVLLVINHMAADGQASLVLQKDFETILGGVALPPAPGPLEMALEQQATGGSMRLRNAERYWRRTLAAAPRKAAGPTTGEPVGATLHTGLPVPMGHEGAAALEITLASLLLAAYYRAVRDVTGAEAVLIYAMSSNRYEAAQAEVVTSLNQWVPLLLDIDSAEPFGSLATKVHWKSFSGLKHGFCDPDAILAARAEQHDSDPGYNFNPLVAPPGFPSDATLCDPRIEWYPPLRTTGPGFYLIARAASTVELVLRLNRPGWDPAAVEAFLTSVQNTLADTTGAKRL